MLLQEGAFYTVNTTLIQEKSAFKSGKSPIFVVAVKITNLHYPQLCKRYAIIGANYKVI